MPIIITIDTLLARRRMTLMQLSQVIDMDYNRLSRLKLGQVKSVRLETVYKICTVLQCHPGDIIKFVKAGDNKKTMINQTHPLPDFKN